MATLACLAWPFLIAAPAAALQTVHVVQGGPPTALQDAVDAAGDRHVVLAKGGTYGPLHIAGKAITVVAEPAGATTVGPIRSDGVPAGSACVLAGLVVRAPFPDGRALRIESCAGSVRLQNLNAASLAESSADGAYVVGCADVAFVRCTLAGGSQKPKRGNTNDFPIARGLAVEASQVALHECEVTGGDGQDAHFQPNLNTNPARPGGAAVEVDGGSLLFVAASTAVGGAGGDGRGLACVHLPCGLAPTPGTDGGPGLLARPGAAVHLLDDALAGGAGGLGGDGGQCCPQTIWPAAANGSPGPDVVGGVQLLPGPSLLLAAPDVARELEQVVFTLTGPPGDEAYLISSTRAQGQPALGLLGVLHVQPPLRRERLGTIPSSGVLQVALPQIVLPPGLESLRLFHQAVRIDAEGQVRLGALAMLTLLDGAF